MSRSGTGTTWELWLQRAASAVCVLASVSPATIAQDSATAASIPTRDYEVAVLRCLRNGEIEKALATLGEAADVTPSRRFSEIGGLSAAAGGLHRALTQLDSDTRFDLLYGWAMPTESRRTVRTLTTLVPQVAPPKAFARELGQRPRDDSFPIASVGEIRGLFSTGWSLVGAADEIGRLRRLTTELEQLASDDVPGADVMLLLARLADSRSDAAGLAESLAKRIPAIRGARPNSREPSDSGQPPALVETSDVLLAAAGLTHESLRAISEDIFRALVELSPPDTAAQAKAFLRLAHATAVQLSRGESGADRIRQNRLMYWNSGHASAIHTGGGIDAVWLVHDDQILHLAGSGNDVLFFRYPLTGEFEFSCEVQQGGHGETSGGLVYGGLQFETNSRTGQLTVWDADFMNSVQTAGRFIRHRNRPAFNHLSIQSKEEQLTFALNHEAIWSEPSTAATASPWLGLRSLGERRPIFRNFTLTGNPVIPRQVALTAGPSLRGWQARYHDESPRPTAAAVAKFDETTGLIREVQSPLPLAPDQSGWNLVQGVIHGVKRHVRDGEHGQCCLTYQRPLLDGESISYEFRYEAGLHETHPAIGRLAFLIEPDGVRVHWVTDGDREWTGLSPDNSVLEPLNRRGPRKLPLKNNDWNSVIFSRAGGQVTLALNGTTVYERAIDFGGNGTFGFYCDATRVTALIRNVILTGNWPEVLPQDFVDNPAVAGGH